MDTRLAVSFDKYFLEIISNFDYPSLFFDKVTSNNFMPSFGSQLIRKQRKEKENYHTCALCS